MEAAINAIVEDATQCKFESTSNASDEVVLLNIVQVGGGSGGWCYSVLLLGGDSNVCWGQLGASRKRRKFRGGSVIPVEFLVYGGGLQLICTIF